MDEAGVNPVIKVWNMDKKEKGGNPFCTRIQPAIPNNTPTDVCCIWCWLMTIGVNFWGGIATLEI